ncbi:hypothetical protein ACFQ7B_35580 [Streptomyces erythrochromogenes]|uniref:hypothetical protein n=1 Tax=Streptomyces erythrochromogenes TaxID=285574 RepID=UPI00369BC055
MSTDATGATGSTQKPCPYTRTLDDTSRRTVRVTVDFVCPALRAPDNFVDIYAGARAPDPGNDDPELIEPGGVPPDHHVGLVENEDPGSSIAYEVSVPIQWLICERGEGGCRERPDESG